MENFLGDRNGVVKGLRGYFDSKEIEGMEVQTIKSKKQIDLPSAATESDKRRVYFLRCGERN